MTLTNLPTLGTVIVTALIDSINPCAIGVLILLISTLTLLAFNKKRMFLTGLIYIFSVYAVYFAAGVGLIAVLTTIPLKITEYISMAVAIVVIGGGLVEVKNYFWYGVGFTLSIPVSRIKYIKRHMKNATIPGMILLGAFVAAVELPCTGGPYLAITTLLARDFSFSAFYLLALYNFIFILPLLAILFAVLFGANIKKIKEWKMHHRKYMRLAMGVIMIGLGLLLMLIANGMFNLG